MLTNEDYKKLNVDLRAFRYKKEEKLQREERPSEMDPNSDYFDESKPTEDFASLQGQISSSSSLRTENAPSCSVERAFETQVISNNSVGEDIVGTVTSEGLRGFLHEKTPSPGAMELKGE
mmetsp:Transcript_9320/g.15712  ORF Transcript_9320/g.15712 Transcript_9320/m.15712 type:complete len:120 (-) Transcript_9320:353-712(-)